MFREKNAAAPAAWIIKVPEQLLLLDKSKRTAMGSSDAFREYLRFSKQDSNTFWEQIASEFEWTRRWDIVQKGTLPECTRWSKNRPQDGE